MKLLYRKIQQERRVAADPGQAHGAGAYAGPG